MSEYSAFDIAVAKLIIMAKAFDFGEERTIKALDAMIKDMFPEQADNNTTFIYHYMRKHLDAADAIHGPTSKETIALISALERMN